MSKLKKQAILKALEKSLGVVTTACKSADLSRTQFYEWLKTDDDFRSSVNELNDVVLDFAESKLHKLIDDGNVAATIFLLKTKGRGRGFVESTEMTITTPNKKPSWFTTEEVKEG
jgi:hypothetical protein